MTRYIKSSALVVLVLVLLISCDQEKISPETNTASGGGTLTTYKAYKIDSIPGTKVYGRVVFWKDSENRTLVQVSLYNTITDTMHPVTLTKGAIGTETETIMTFYDVSGTTGEFGTSKFYTITDVTFYDSLEPQATMGLDAHVNIYLSTANKTIVAAGNIGKNADPVESN